MAPTTKLTLSKQKRRGFRLNVQKLVGQVHGTWDAKDEHIDIASLTIAREKLQKYETELETLNNEIEIAIDEDELESELEKSSEIKEEIWDTVSKISIMIGAATNPKNNDNDSNSGATHTTNKNTTVKLPKLELNKFEGNPLEWQEFWDSFESTIHENSDVPTIDKFKYLKSYLGGSALRVVEGFRLTVANYTSVVETLQERFGSPERAVFAHFESLLSLPMSNIDTPSLQKTYDECEKHIRSLVSLGLVEDTFGQVFTPIILSKLPRTIRVEIHRKNGSSPWTLSALRECLRDEIKAREMGDWAIGDKGRSDNTTDSEPKPQGPRNFQQNSKGNQQHRSYPPTTGAFVQNSRPVPKCIFCNQQHYSDQCTEVTSLHARKAALYNHCFKCLRSGHNSKSCIKESYCYHCRATDHHSALCKDRPVYPSSDPNASDSQSNSAKSYLNAKAKFFSPKTQAGSCIANTHNVLYQMQMAVVHFKNADISARVFFDIGSSRSYITTGLARVLNVPSCGQEIISNARFGDTCRQTKTFNKATFSIPTCKGPQIPITALVTDTISCPIQKMALSTDRYPILSQITLADPLTTESGSVPIDILIGMDYYYKIVNSERIDLDDGLVLLGSKLGYITAGQVENDQCDDDSFVNATLLNLGDNTGFRSFDVERFWSLEDIGIKDDSYAKDDELATQKFNDSIQLINGRYHVGWPWKEQSPDLPSNFPLALARFRSLMKRIGGDQNVLKAYDDTIRNQIQAGIIEEVSENDSNHLVHYIPHHCVEKPDKATTKLRIVYDASAKANRSSLSLNDCLLRGPVFLQDLCGLLLRFRTYPIAITGDIEKAFLQVALHCSDRDVTRFFWLRDPRKPLTPDNLVIYRFCRIPFGVISSPFLLAGTIRYHLGQKNCPLANHIAENVYVDNTLCGQDTVERAKHFYQVSKGYFNEISMNLREWFSNSAEFMSSLPEHDRGNGSTTKVLGMEWDTTADTFSCSDPKLKGITVSTKRGLLRSVSKIFDPCGLVSPIVVRVKMLVQDVWKKKLGWDEKLPDEVVTQFDAYSADLSGVPGIKIPRFVGKVTDQWQIHCFCDASARAYAAAVYLRAPAPMFEVNLMFCKTKLSPIRKITIPRLELMAFVLGVRLVNFVRQQLHDQSSVSFIWSDSKCVLHWISSSKVLTVFVQNRVREIRKFQNNHRYVPTDHNPADIASRGMDLSEFTESDLWWKGPPFLQKPENCWPGTDIGTTNDQFESEALSDEAVAMMNHVDEPAPIFGPLGINPAQYSTLNRLLRVTAWILRYVRNLRNSGERIKSYKQTVSIKSVSLSVSEIANAELLWVVHIQQHALDVNPNEAKSQKFDNLKRQLDLFVDSNRIVRCGGRLRHSDLTDDAKFPILLPKNNGFTELVIIDFHNRLQHAGVRHTLSEFRNRFWVSCGKSQVKAVLKKCQLCKIVEGGPFTTPVIAPLPAFRVSQTSPFAFVGIDYLGPLCIKSDDGTSKVWICIFTCAATRAIHLEVVTDLSTGQFLLCLRRFVSLFRTPQMIISDNGTYFKLANDVIRNLWSEVLNSADVQNYSTTARIEWKFIPEFSPWMGGFYERLVGSVKRALKKVLGKTCVNLVQLQTIVAEVASILNTRPLVPSDEVSEQMLTPAHLLGKVNFDKFPIIPDSSAFKVKTSHADQLLEHWRSTSQLLNEFWQVWRSQYLTSLRESPGKIRNWNTSKTEPSVGTVVLVKDNLPRCSWRMGRVSMVRISGDGKCRSALVRMSNGRELTRPLKLLFPIESSTTETECDSDCDKNNKAHKNNQAIPARPSRNSANHAREKIRKQLKELSSESE